MSLSKLTGSGSSAPGSPPSKRTSTLVDHQLHSVGPHAAALLVCSAHTSNKIGQCGNTTSQLLTWCAATAVSHSCLCMQVCRRILQTSQQIVTHRWSRSNLCGGKRASVKAGMVAKAAEETVGYTTDTTLNRALKICRRFWPHLSIPCRWTWRQWWWPWQAVVAVVAAHTEPHTSSQLVIQTTIANTAQFDAGVVLGGCSPA